MTVNKVVYNVWMYSDVMHILSAAEAGCDCLGHFLNAATCVGMHVRACEGSGGRAV